MESTFQCTVPMNQGHCHTLKMQDSVERGATRRNRKLPGLQGFVAKHLLRAGEFESTQEKGWTKNNTGVKQVEPVCAVETQLQGDVQKKPERHRD